MIVVWQSNNTENKLTNLIIRRIKVIFWKIFQECIFYQHICLLIITTETYSYFIDKATKGDTRMRQCFPYHWHALSSMTNSILPSIEGIVQCHIAWFYGLLIKRRGFYSVCQVNHRRNMGKSKCDSINGKIFVIYPAFGLVISSQG